MRRFLAISTVAAALWAQSGQPYVTVSGTVTNGVTGEPIPRAHVVVNCGQTPYGALTTEKGEFRIPGVPGPNCIVRAERVGFISALNFDVYNHPERTGSEFQLTLVLTPTGAITGRVLNSAGEPLEDVAVSAERLAGSSGATTGDGGMFRLGGLMPGKYYVKADPRPLPFPLWGPYPAEIRTDGSREVHEAATYYPDALEAEAASRVQVKAGEEVSGIEIRLVQTRLVTISGKVIGLPPGTRNATVMGAPVKTDGSFAFQKQAPGKYKLVAGIPLGASELASAPVEIEVGASDVTSLELRIVPAFDISGRVRYEDDQAREVASPGLPPQFSLVNMDGFQSSAGVRVTDDRFTFQGVQPDTYRLVSTGFRAYVKSVRAGDTETAGNLIDARAGSPGPLTVTLSSNFCAVSGTVRDSGGPVANASVRLVHLESIEDRFRPYVQRSGSSGAYRVGELPPGKYRLTATYDGASDPEDEDDTGQTIELRAGDRMTQDLVLRRPDR